MLRRLEFFKNNSFLNSSSKTCLWENAFFSLNFRMKYKYVKD